jgi:hypothetical protein
MVVKELVKYLHRLLAIVYGIILSVQRGADFKKFLLLLPVPCESFWIFT